MKVWIIGGIMLAVLAAIGYSVVNQSAPSTSNRDRTDDYTGQIYTGFPAWANAQDDNLKNANEEYCVDLQRYVLDNTTFSAFLHPGKVHCFNDVQWYGPYQIPITINFPTKQGDWCMYFGYDRVDQENNYAKKGEIAQRQWLL